MARYHAPAPPPVAGAIVAETLEGVVREGARRMLQRALEAEVEAFLGRAPYAPGGRQTGYPNRSPAACWSSSVPAPTGARSSWA